MDFLNQACTRDDGCQAVDLSLYHDKEALSDSINRKWMTVHLDKVSMLHGDRPAANLAEASRYLLLKLSHNFIICLQVLYSS